MGGSWSFMPVQEPMWFSYYGPIRHAEASEALDAAITSHLQEIGSASAVPIRQEVAAHVEVPVGLNSPPFTESDGVIVVHFATSLAGTLTFVFGDVIEQKEFPADFDNTFSFASVGKGKATLKFEFDVTDGVSARIFVLNVGESGLPTISDDKLVTGGMESSISRVYVGQEAGGSGSGDFSDGQCLICCAEPATVIAYPCRHCCMCRKCSEKFASTSNHCPVCRATVLELIDCGVFEEKG